MEYFKAKNDKQLGLCIRMLLAERMDNIIVNPIMNDKHKVEFFIRVDADEEQLLVLKERYDTLIS